MIDFKTTPQHTARIFITSMMVIATMAGSLASAADGLKFHEDFDKAMAQAKASNKPIVTIFSASWCGPCRKMKSKVYPSPEVKPYHESFVWAYLDADKSKNRGLMKQMQVSGIPHISFISPDGEELGKSVGSVAPSAFAGQLNSILKKYKPGATVPIPAASPPAEPEKKKGLFSKIFKKKQ